MKSQLFVISVAGFLALSRGGLVPAQTTAAPQAVEAVSPCKSAALAQSSEVARRRPGVDPNAAQIEPCDPNRLPKVSADQIADDPEAVPDRWKIVHDLGYRVDWLNSYPGDNPLKADTPVLGEDFFNLSAVAGSLLEERRIPSTAAGTPDATGARTATGNSLFFNQSLSLDALLYRGETIFRCCAAFARTPSV
jgi:hypothetical protein